MRIPKGERRRKGIESQIRRRSALARQVTRIPRIGSPRDKPDVTVIPEEKCQGSDSSILE
jgi:hypothetical protein